MISSLRNKAIYQFETLKFHVTGIKICNLREDSPDNTQMRIDHGSLARYHAKQQILFSFVSVF